jgi:hypothetical protein
MGYNAFGFIALVIFLFLLVVSISSDRGYFSDSGSFSDMGVCHVSAGSTREDIYSSCSIV